MLSALSGQAPEGPPCKLWLSGIIDRIGELAGKASPIHEVPEGKEIERMSIIRSSTKMDTTAPVTNTPIMTPEQFIEHLRGLPPQLPDFVLLPKSPEMANVRRIANLGTEIAQEGIGAIGASEVVQSAIGLTPEQMHAAEDEIARWAVAEGEAYTLYRGLADANLVRRHRLGLALMQAYNVSRQLVRQEEHAHLLPHVQRIFHVRKLARRRIKPAAAPQTQPPVTTQA
ncbi:MAG TPA: hypothetical protein VEK57_13990 [Thermoanaerobaculia bacterium]|nr:hypothetical protein [Thermoanaerobaculia bacterium]